MIGEGKLENNISIKIINLADKKVSIIEQKTDEFDCSPFISFFSPNTRLFLRPYRIPLLVRSQNVS